MQNRAGKFVQPSEASFKAAASGADWEKSFYQILTDQPGDESWPITSATFIMMHKKQDKPAQAAAALNFFAWAYANGDAQALNLDYVPMPQAVKEIVMRSWQSITDTSGKAIRP
jgi:phosphate transport system substrate-binding protein